MIGRLGIHLLFNTFVEEPLGIIAYVLCIELGIPLVVFAAVCVPQVNKIGVFSLKVLVFDEQSVQDFDR
jgi:hypothetical protein